MSIHWLLAFVVSVGRELSVLLLFLWRWLVLLLWLLLRLLHVCFLAVWLLLVVKLCAQIPFAFTPFRFLIFLYICGLMLSVNLENTSVISSNITSAPLSVFFLSGAPIIHSRPFTYLCLVCFSFFFFLSELQTKYFFCPNSGNSPFSCVKFSVIPTHWVFFF